MVWETPKIRGDENIRVNPTAVRVPVFFGDSMAVHIETRDKISAARARHYCPGPSPAGRLPHRDNAFVGRIREEILVRDYF